MKKLMIVLILLGINAIPIISYNSKKSVHISELYRVIEKKEIVAEGCGGARPIKVRTLLTESILDKQINTESRGKHMVEDRNGDKHLIRSRAGAVGIAQFLPSTWKWMKFAKLIPKNYNIANKEHQISAQRILMNYLYSRDYGIDYDKTILALASYNAGSGRVRKLIRKYKQDWESHLPRETKKYIKLITT